MKCKKCGKKLRRNEMFCTVCGYYNDFSEKDNTSDIPSDEDLLDDDWSADEIEEVEIEEDDDISEDEFKVLDQKCTALRAMLIASINTTKQNMQ